MLYRDDRGWGFSTPKAELEQQLAEMRQRLERLEGQRASRSAHAVEEA